MVAADFSFCIKIICLYFTDLTLCTSFQESRRWLLVLGLYTLFTKLYFFVYSIHYMDNINYLTKKHTFAFSIFDNRLPS